MNESIRPLADGRVAVRFERVLHHPPERVWSALTDREQLRAWFVDVLDYDHSALDFGADAELIFIAAGDVVGRGRVTSYEPPTLLEYTWDAEVLRWEISVHDTGSLLIFTNIVDDADTAAAVTEGWSTSLDRVAALLGGVDARG